MKIRIVGVLLMVIFFSACASIPKESVTLSQTLGNDLRVLHNAHRNIVEIHFKKIKGDINSFVDDVYAPFVIHYVLNGELKKFKTGNPSLYGTIEIAGQNDGKAESENALKEMGDFLEAAHKQIEGKRTELLLPIIKQETEIVMAVNQSYEHAIYANSTITVYLQSLQKVKDAQKEALSMVGLDGADALITNSMVKLSDQVETFVREGKNIDIKSDDAYLQLEKITNQIKEITNQK